MSEIQIVRQTVRRPESLRKRGSCSTKPVKQMLREVAHASELHNRALALKVQCFGEQSIQAGLSFNEVGECYL